MNTIVIVEAVVLAIALITLIIVICIVLSGKRKRRNQYQKQRKNVLVKNGVDVKKQVIGGEKGEYFTGNLEKQGTHYVNHNIIVWRVVFDNLNTSERMYMDFTRQMWIGRTDASQNEVAKLMIPGDERVSRNHCTIYESGDRLCLKDLNSSNHTYLNGNMITNAVYLQSGDVIRVGNTQVKVQYSRVNDRPT